MSPIPAKYKFKIIIDLNKLTYLPAPNVKEKQKYQSIKHSK
jgi:hypothetical protein